MCHLVVCPSKLEAEDWLEIFSFQKDFAFEPVAEVNGVREGSFFDHIGDAGRED